MRGAAHGELPRRDGTIERTLSSALVLADEARARAAGIRGYPRRRFSELLCFRHDAVSARQLDAQGGWHGRTPGGLHALPVEADGALRPTHPSSLRRGMVCGRVLAGCPRERYRETGRPQARRAVRRVPLVRFRILFVLGYAKRDASTNDSRLRNERRRPRGRSRRAAAPLFGRETWLQEREVSDRGELPTHAHGRLLGEPRVRMVRRRVICIQHIEVRDEPN